MTKLYLTKKKHNAYISGKEAEKYAIEYLKKLDWKIIANNLKTKYGEIDIIAYKNDTLVAFEVKTRTDIEILEYSITKKQQDRIINAFNYFLSQKKEFESYNIRIDAIFIYKNQDINHIENAWSD